MKPRRPPQKASSPDSDAYREMWDSDDQETKDAEFAGDLTDEQEAKP